MICCICGIDRESAQTINLTSEEKTSASKMTKEKVADSYSYCQPCWAIVSHKERGLQLLKGMLQVGFRNAGLINAEELARRYQEFFSGKAKKKLV